MNKKIFSVVVFGLFVIVFDSKSQIKSNTHNKSYVSDPKSYKSLNESLLRQWCDGLMRELIIDPLRPEYDGTFNCPATGMVHSRSIDAVYPFLKMAKLTGDKKYIDAAKALFNAGNRITLPNGAWTNEPSPKSWQSTTVFAAISVMEALHYHGDLLDEATRKQWTDRLKKAADYIYNNINKLDYANVNYGITAIYANYLLGETFHEEKYFQRSRELAGNLKKYMTTPNFLIYGEGRPIDRLSAKGLHPVDLAYNVEESLNSVVMYALAVKDTALINLAKKSLEGHLEFMLPDGAWDNSWGTRQAKWSYWGSRTSDGCAPAFALMAHLNPAFGTAVYLNTQLLQQCTKNGLLHGGPHYASHGVLPSVHHTFTHAKPLALMLDMTDKLPNINVSTALPRVKSQKSKYYPELDTWLLSRGPWRATVTGYDFKYRPEIQQATGGVISVLWHQKVGLLLAASMAKYVKVEAHNMQNQPNKEDFILTPRIETKINGVTYSNTFDLAASINCDEKTNATSFDVNIQLKDEKNNAQNQSDLRYKLNYLFNDKKLVINAREIENTSKAQAFMYLPIVSQTGEKVTRINANKIEIEKPQGTVVIESNVALQIKKMTKERVFNLVPGVEAVPVFVDLQNSSNTDVYCTISVK